MTPTTTRDNRSSKTTNMLLGVIACLLGANLLIKSETALVSTATAQPSATPLNSAESMRRAADGIAELNQRLGRLEGKFDKTLQVKITESIPLTVTGLPTADKSDRADGNK